MIKTNHINTGLQNRLNTSRLIAFDLFGVLISEGQLIANGLMKLLPSSCMKQTVKAAYNQFNIGDITEKHFWQKIQSCITNSPGQQNQKTTQFGEADQLRNEFLDLFQLDPDYDLVIDALGTKHRLAILSNFPPDWADTLMQKFGFGDLFNPCLFSGHCGYKKPQPEIYKLLIDKSKTPADQIIFIDDRRENLQTAHTLGVTTVQYWREPDSHDFKADLTLYSLDELLTFFK